MTHFKKIFTVFTIFLLVGCYEKPMSDNVVALVNDRPITLNTVRYLNEIDLVHLNENGKTSFAKIRKQYGVILSKVILYEMVVQTLEKYNIAITNEQVSAYENNLRNAYPPDEFEKFITENAVDIDAWRILLRYQLTMDAFKDFVLLKNYVAPIDEVKNYYIKYKNSFNIPKSYNLQVAISEDKADLANIINLEALKQKTELEQYSLNIREQSIEPSWLSAIMTLQEQECTDILEQNDVFSRICLVKKEDSRNLSIAEAYVYIEKKLAEKHLSQLFDQWIEQNLQKFQIQVSKHLSQEIM